MSKNGRGMFYTIGYEGMELDPFVQRLKERGIEQLIDIRERPSSRKGGFSKTPLSRRLEEEGIAYLHLPGVGTPPEMRHKYKAGGSLEEFLGSYSKHLDAHPEALASAREAVRSRISVLMCYEADHRRCHRSVLSERLAESGMEAIHL